MVYWVAAVFICFLGEKKRQVLNTNIKYSHYRIHVIIKMIAEENTTIWHPEFYHNEAEKS